MLIKVTDLRRKVVNTNIDLYVQDRTIDAIIGCTGKNIYEDYLEFCSQNNLPNNLTNTQFRLRLCRSYNLTSFVTTVNGRSVRVIVEK